jgi:hypothetical protein
MFAAALAAVTKSRILNSFSLPAKITAAHPNTPFLLKDLSSLQDRASGRKPALTAPDGVWNHHKKRVGS